MLFSSGTPEYDEATRPDNSSVEQHPASVALPRSADELSAVVREAERLGKTVVPQSTGHGAGAPVGADDILLSTSSLDHITIDAGARTATVGSGALWGAINDAVYAHGLLGLAGSSPTVGVSGYTFAGGVGWLGRAHGMAAGSLRQVTFVDGGGRIRIASDDADDPEDREAMWAFRGAGGIGIAVSLEFDLFDASALHAGYLLWPASDLDAVVAAWATHAPSTGAGMASSIGVLHVPPSPPFPEDLRGEVAVHLALADPDGDSAGTLLESVRAAAAPVVDTWGPSDAARVSQIHLDPPAAVPAYGDARWLTAETPTIAHDVFAIAADEKSPVSMMDIRHVATDAPARDGGMTSPPGTFIYHAVGALTGPSSRAELDGTFEKARRTLGGADTGVSVGSWMEGSAGVADALPDEVRERALRIADAVDPAKRIRRSRLLG